LQCLKFITFIEEFHHVCFRESDVVAVQHHCIASDRNAAARRAAVRNVVPCGQPLRVQRDDVRGAGKVGRRQHLPYVRHRADDGEQRRTPDPSHHRQLRPAGDARQRERPVFHRPDEHRNQSPREVQVPAGRPMPTGDDRRHQ